MFRKIVGSIWRKLPYHWFVSIACWKILSESYGHFKSASEWAAVNAVGEAIPGITYPCIDFLNQFDFSPKKIFEYGAGNSTLFWTKRAKSVVSVESDKKWYEKIWKDLSANVTYIYSEPECFARQIDAYDETFDLIVVDGCCR